MEGVTREGRRKYMYMYIDRGKWRSKRSIGKAIGLVTRMFTTYMVLWKHHNEEKEHKPSAQL